MSGQAQAVADLYREEDRRRIVRDAFTAFIRAIDERIKRHGEFAITSASLRQIAEESITPANFDYALPVETAPARIKREWPKTMQRLGPDNNVVEERQVQNVIDQQNLTRNGQRWYLKPA